MVFSQVWAESWCGWLCCRFTTILLLVIAAMSILINFSKPISCFNPAQFTDNHVDYAQKMCFDADTHSSYLLYTEEDGPHIAIQHPAYYHAVPLLLLCLCLISLFPHLLWKIFSSVTKQPISAIGDAAKTWTLLSPNSDKDSQKNAIQFIAQLFLSSSTRGARMVFTFSFLLVQVFVFLSSLGLFVMVDNLLCATSETGHFFHGIQLLINLHKGTSWLGSVNFPPSAMCDFHVMMAGRVANYTAQCTMSVNTLQYMLLLVTWCWLLVLLLVSLVNGFYWLFVSVAPGTSSGYVRTRLTAMATQTTNQEMNIEATVQLMATNNDELLMIRLLAASTSDYLASLVLWEIAKVREPSRLVELSKM